MSNNSKHIFARLLANENITVVHGNFNTASFNLHTRTLNLPLWNDMQVYDLLLGHEVGHALFTPMREWFQYNNNHNGHIDLLNIIEDVRIERLIQRKYPGLVPAFKKGYSIMFDRDLFKINKATYIKLNDYSFLDRLNLKAKLRDIITVEFNDTEKKFFDRANTIETFDEVIALKNDIADYLGKIKENITGITVLVNSADMENESDKKDDDTTVVASNNNDKSMSKNEQTEKSESLSSSSDVAKNEEDKEDKTYTFVEKPNGDTIIVSTAHDNTNPLDQSVSRTYEALEKSKDVFIDKDDKGLRTYVCQGISKEQMNDIIVPYEKLRTRRTNSDNCSKKTIEFHKDIKNSVANMIKEFEMRKAAYQYKKASVSKTGTLDVDKLYNYKLSDDLFLRSIKLGEFKDHGMVMLVDYSGSMRYIMKSVIRQVLILATFCKKVSIPFEIYGFTQSFKSHVGEQVNYIKTKGIHVFNILSSSFTKEQYKEAFDYLVKKAHVDPIKKDYAYRDEGYESMGDTPLNESLIVMHKILHDFKKKYNNQKTIFTTLTDGEATWMNFNIDPNDYMRYGKKKVKVGSEFLEYAVHSINFTEKLLMNMRKQNLCDVTLSYFLTSPGYFSSYLYRFSNKKETEKTANVDTEKAKKKFKTDGYYAFDNVGGYDRIIMVKQDNSLFDNEEEIDVTSISTRTKIAKEFKKYTLSKKNNRMIATKFSEIMA